MNWHPTDLRELPSRRARRGLSGRAKVIIVVIIVVGIAWYLLGFLETPADAVESSPQALPASGTSDSDNQPLAGVIERSAASDPLADTLVSPRSPGDQARAIIERIGPEPGLAELRSVHAEAEALRGADQSADAYLLYFYAARQGHAPSALALGEMADSGRGPGAVGSADLAEAHKWYALAARLGDPDGIERLAELRRRVEAAAEAGDPQAERLRLQWR